MSGQQKSNKAYFFPTSIDEAIALLEGGAGEFQIIAGGTDILPDIRHGKISPCGLVDITRIPGLDQITITRDYVEIGAAVTFADIKVSPFINQHIHALADAAASVGALAIQNTATWVGNIIQAMPAADGAIIAIALNAEVHLIDGNRAEWLPVETLFVGPGLSVVDPTRQFITHIRFSREYERWGTAWQRIGRRPSLTLPILNCAITIKLSLDSQRIEHATIALGPVAMRPYRAHSAEEFIKGQPLSKKTIVKTAQLVQEGAQPRDNVIRASREYRLAIIPTMVETTINAAAIRASNSLLSPPTKQSFDLHREGEPVPDQQMEC
jgi:CO/xanthine dehydrogenase FAD-binding subunit